MTIIEKFNFNSMYFLNQTAEQQNFSKIPSSKFVDYFDHVYTYPPKIRVKWDNLDDLNKDIPISKHTEDWFFSDTPDEATSERYILPQYVEGYLEKVNSSTFFNKKTKTLQTSLSTIPIYTIINGHGKIVLSKPTNSLGSKAFSSYLSQKAYDYCGAFDNNNVEKRQQLGLFFISYLDAEKYLQEIARTDIDGTQALGLSIHSIGLDSAYRITREHHPGIDFRFIPNFSEVKTLLEDKSTNSKIVVEKNQQQLRYRRRRVNLFPYFEKLGSILSPTVSFLQKDEYFKGVPIYVVQFSDTQKNPLVEQYFNIVGTFDSLYGKIAHFISQPLGFGQNSIIQGSIKDVANSDRYTNYIFFEKAQVENFIKLNKKWVKHYNGSHINKIQSIIKKPKIFLYNLEDFLEDWEDNIYTDSFVSEKTVKTLLNGKSNYFIPPTQNLNEGVNFSNNYKSNPIKNFGQTLNLKFRVFKQVIGMFLNVG